LLVADLVPKEAAEAWLKYLREEMPAIAFKCSTQKQSSNLSRKASTSARGSECLGADMLIQLLKNYARGKGGLKTSVTVGIVGLPNVGKSSLINSLKRSKVAKVGNAPGITKSVQEVHLDKQVTLLDSPGVVFAEAGEDGKAAAALRNCVKIEQLEDPTLPVSEILRRCPEKQLMTLYRIPQYDDVDGFLTHIATVRGKLRKGGTVDKTAAAKIILQDWNDGKIPYFTSPPERKSDVQGSSAIFANWSEDFDLTALDNEQAAVIETLDSVDMGSGAKIFFQADTAGEAHMAVDVDSDAMDEDQPQPGSKRQLRSQNDRLYDNEGQYNPHKVKGKKKAKQEKYQDVADEMEADSDSDFDFAEIPEAENAFAQLENDSE
jgi:nuclear GTP-binding protein